MQAVVAELQGEKIDIISWSDQPANFIVNALAPAEVSKVVLDEEQSLNGISRGETDKSIRKHFGSLDDFLLTSMSSQLGSLTFVSEGNKNRKKILAKFLDLIFFNKKHLLAKEEAAEAAPAVEEAAPSAPKKKVVRRKKVADQ